MKINGIDIQHNLGKTGNTPEKETTLNGQSFLDMMKLRSMQQPVAKASETQETSAVFEVAEAAPITSMTGIDSISAIALKARIQYTPPTNDVSDFLELIGKSSGLLEGQDLSSITNSQGGAELSQEQIDLLKAKFNVHDISGDDQLELLSELASRGVLNKADIEKLMQSVSPKPGDVMEQLANEASYKDVDKIDANDMLSRLEAMINNENFTYDHVLDRYGQKTTNVKDLADSHQKVAEVLHKLE